MRSATSIPRMATTISSSTKEVLPVIRIDDKLVGNGEPGPMWQQIINYYADYKKRLVAGEID